MAATQGTTYATEQLATVDRYIARLEGDRQLLNQLTAVLMRHCGERGESEGAVETLERIIRERDEARPHV
jgi:hypothetical protein